jgi:hypothetical protein
VAGGKAMTRMTIKDVQDSMGNHRKCDECLIGIFKKFVIENQEAIKKKLLSEYQHKDTL